MLKPTTICLSLLSLLISHTTVLAQEGPGTVTRPSAVTITASASGNQVRFAAPSSAVQIRLEVYNAAGRKLFDNEMRAGNVLDWLLRDGQAQPLADGAYLCLITVKSLSGKLTQTIAAVTVANSAARLEATTAAQMTPQQAEAIGPVEESMALTVMQGDAPPAATVLAHNGEAGQLTRSTGDLSFRLGDFFSGKDTEQMRLTAEGNLGLGIAQPRTRLDVDGLIRTNHGIVFPDGSVQFSASRKTFGPTSLKPGEFQQKGVAGQEHLAPDIGGTGTTGKISKWTDGPAGLLGDSNITETSGAIGINGTPSTSFRLDVNGSTRIRGSNPGFNLEGLRAAGNIWLFQTVDDDGRFRLFSQDNVNPGQERLTIMLDSGNVGIGASSPTSKLDVRGHLTLEAGDSPVIYTSVASTEQNRFLQLVNSLGRPSASGLKAGGILVADNYDFAVPGKNDLIVKGNVGIGTPSPEAILHVATSPLANSSSLVVGGSGVGIGTTTPARLLHVNGRARIGSIPQEASAASVCFNVVGDLLQCGASSLRLKTNIRSFVSGLDVVYRLRPISFNWKEDGRPDIGLGAEDVAKVAPSLTFTNSEGEVTGVKYERLNILLINAIKEQQQQLEMLRRANITLKARLQVIEKRLRKRAGRVRKLMGV